MLRLALLIIPALVLSAPALGASKPIKGGFEAKSYKAKKVKRAKRKTSTESSFTNSAATGTPVLSSPALAPAAVSATNNSASGMILAYKRDPVPIFDETGSKLRDVPKGSLPRANSPAARVVGSKPGFVAIMLGGQRTWLRLTAVDVNTASNLAVPACEKVVVGMAKMEEDGVERSLGLGCKKK